VAERPPVQTVPGAAGPVGRSSRGSG
jgi:hypothetical protein